MGALVVILIFIFIVSMKSEIGDTPTSVKKEDDSFEEYKEYDMTRNMDGKD